MQIMLDPTTQAKRLFFNGESQEEGHINHTDTTHARHDPSSGIVAEHHCQLDSRGGVEELRRAKKKKL